MADNTERISGWLMLAAIILAIALGVVSRPGGIPYFERQDNATALVIPDNDR